MGFEDFLQRTNGADLAFSGHGVRNSFEHTIAKTAVLKHFKAAGEKST